MERSHPFAKTQLPTLLVLALLLPACSAEQASLRAGSVASVAQAASTSRAHAPNNSDGFAGDWSYATDCNFGHYVTLHLEAESDGSFKGDWSDGTNVRGSQGQLKGVVHGQELRTRWCSEVEENGGYPLCPSYSEPEGHLVRRGPDLVWMRQGAGEYVVLKRGASVPGKMQEDCES